ncbi:MAG: ATP-binding cassette domain-containing protein [Micromonosporaceae bacterium]
MTPALELAGLSKTYGHGDRAVHAVRDVDLTVAPGEVLALLGPNGAGKTTTIKMVCGLVSPTSGAARIGGFDVARQRSQAVRRIGAVLEGSRNVYWSLSAWQNLLYFGRLKGLRAGEIKPRAELLLRELGLWQRRGELVGSYSRGMQQKVAVAAALVTDPPIVLLDEPTIGLDVAAARTVKHWITLLARERGKTVVLSTHQLAMAEELADRVAVIRSGRIVADLTTTALLDRYAEPAYDIRVDGHVPAHRGLPDATVETSDGQTRILLPSTNLDDLYPLLARLHAYELPLVSVNRVRPSLEDVFVRLVKEDS